MPPVCISEDFDNIVIVFMINLALLANGRLSKYSLKSWDVINQKSAKFEWIMNCLTDV